MEKGFGANMKKLFKDFKVVVIAFVICIIAELIGTVKFDIMQNGKSLFNFSLFPMLFAIIIGLILCGTGKIKRETMEKATPAISYGVAPLIVFLAKSVGPAWPQIVQAGPALILQEFGNLGTILISLPVAVCVFRMGRAAIGACFSISREPSIAVIADKYGLASPEGTGVMGAYIVGTVLGTLFYGILASICISINLFHPYALAMAAGMGSGSMLTASTAPLVEAFPEMADTIQAYAATSNTLTNADGLYMSLLMAIPFTEWWYKKLARGKFANQKGVEIAVPESKNFPEGE